MIEVNSRSQATQQHNKTAQRSTGEVAKQRSFDESRSFCTCPPSGNQVDGLPLAPRKDAAPASWPFCGRACMYETRRVFSSSGEACDVNVLVNLEFKILILSRLRVQLMNVFKN